MHQQIINSSVLTSTGEAVNFFKSKNKKVITFAGFAELGYEDSNIVKKVAQQIIEANDTDNIIFNSGTLLRDDGEDGIAEIYKIAYGLGIETSGVHPSIALKYCTTHYQSPFENHTFFIIDPSWGGFLDKKQIISPTLQVLLEISSEFIVIGGGKHTADELTAFLRSGKKVQYFPAEMNHHTASKWGKNAGIIISDYRGEAYNVWHQHKP